LNIGGVEQGLEQSLDDIMGNENLTGILLADKQGLCCGARGSLASGRAGLSAAGLGGASGGSSQGGGASAYLTAIYSAATSLVNLVQSPSDSDSQSQSQSELAPSETRSELRSGQSQSSALTILIETDKSQILIGQINGLTTAIARNQT